MIIIELVDILPKEKGNLTAQVRIVFYTASVHKGSLFLRMSVKIDKQKRSFRALKYLFKAVYLGKLVFVTFIPNSIHVISRQTAPIVSIDDPSGFNIGTSLKINF